MSKNYLPKNGFNYVNPVDFRLYSGLSEKEGKPFSLPVTIINNGFLTERFSDDTGDNLVAVEALGKTFVFYRNNGNICLPDSVIVYLNLLSYERDYWIDYRSCLKNHGLEFNIFSVMLAAHFEKSLFTLFKLPTARPTRPEVIVSLLFDAFLSIVRKHDEIGFSNWLDFLPSRWLTDLLTYGVNTCYSDDTGPDTSTIDAAADHIANAILTTDNINEHEVFYSPLTLEHRRFGEQPNDHYRKEIPVRLNLPTGNSLYVLILDKNTDNTFVNILETSTQMDPCVLLKLRILVCLRINNTVPPEHSRINEWLLEDREYIELAATANYLHDRHHAMLFKHTSDARFKEWEHIAQYTWDTYLAKYIEVTKDHLSQLGHYFVLSEWHRDIILPIMTGLFTPDAEVIDEEKYIITYQQLIDGQFTPIELQNTVPPNTYRVAVNKETSEVTIIPY